MMLEEGVPLSFSLNRHVWYKPELFFSTGSEKSTSIGRKTSLPPKGLSNGPITYSLIIEPKLKTKPGEFSLKSINIPKETEVARFKVSDRGVVINWL
jgi:hypothetical protein